MRRYNGPMSERELISGFWGSLSYGEGLALQARLRQGVKDGSGEEHLLLLEHTHVYTLGRNATVEDVLLTPEALEACGVEVHESDRGGQVTYHGPGQLVGYPIINLSPDRRDIRAYVKDLQQVLIRLLADYGVAAEVREGQDFIGVWAGGGKIASIGVHVSRWVTTHGFALNVAPDLSFFTGIVACGLPAVKMTSIAELTDRVVPLPEIAEVCARHLAARFGRRLVYRPDGAPARVSAARSGNRKVRRAASESKVVSE
ncbi:MAG: lipoyl(octanoyl) transferase LipB [Acidobacteriota bacterium]